MSQRNFYVKLKKKKHLTHLELQFYGCIVHTKQKRNEKYVSLKINKFQRVFSIWTEHGA